MKTPQAKHKRNFLEKLRIRLSQFLAFSLLIAAVFTTSRWEDHAPMVAYMLYAIGVALVGIATVGRLWCTLYIGGRKTKQLVVEGPYSITRNPLYFFSLLGAVGVGLATETLLLPLGIAIVFAMYYPWVIRREAIKMAAVHGTAYDEYARTTPMFFPKWSLLREPESYATNPQLFRRHMLPAAWFVWIVGLIEAAEGLRQSGLLPCWLRIY